MWLVGNGLAIPSLSRSVFGLRRFETGAFELTATLVCRLIAIAFDGHADPTKSWFVEIIGPLEVPFRELPNLSTRGLSALRLQPLDVVPIGPQNGLAVAAEPAVEQRGVDAPEVGVVLQVARIEVR